MANRHPVSRFKPGQSGNPGGRPKGTSLTARLRFRLAQVEPGSGQSYADLLVEALVGEALKGDVQAARTILERVDGKLPDKVKVQETRKAYVTVGPEDLWPGDDDPSVAGRIELGLP